MVAIKPRAEPAEILKKIQDALRCSAEVDAHRIMIEINGSE